VRGRLTIALLVVSIAIAGSAWSSRLSPLTRATLLDGLGPLTPYNWIDPPPDAPAAGQPAVGAFRIDITGGETVPEVVFTADDQVTMIMDQGAVRSNDDDAISLTITPRAPKGVPPVPDGLVGFGNAIAIEATLRPSGDVVASFDDVAVVLRYPETATLHAAAHELLYSADDSTWQRLETNDSLAQQLVQAALPGPGTLLVAGVPKEAPSIASPGGETATTIATISLVVAVSAALVALGLWLRALRRRVEDRA